MYGKRIVATAVSIFALGVVFGITMIGFDTFSFRAVFAVIFVLSVVFMAVAARPNGNTASKQITATALAVAAFSLGVLRVSLYNDTAVSTVPFDNKTDIAVFEVSEINDNSIDARVITSNVGVASGELVRIYLTEIPNQLFVGDNLQCEVTYTHRTTTSFLSNDITLSASGNMISYKEGSGVFYRIRRSVSESSDFLYERFNYASGIAKGVTIGDRSGIDSYVFSLYKASGISHILAISGLHISIISMSIYRILLTLPLNRKIINSASALFAVFYCAIVGFTAGAVRATVMLIIVMVSRMFIRRADGFTSLFIALLILLIINPFSILSAGLQLSFLCSLGIMLVEPFLDDFNSRFVFRRREDGIMKIIFHRLASLVVPSFVIAFVASVFSFPVLFISFDTFSCVSPLINIIAVPLFTVGVELAFLAFLLAPLWNTLGALIAFPAGVIFDFVTEISKFVYDFDIGILSVYIPYMVIPLIISIGIIASLIFCTRNRLRVSCGLSLLFCLSLVMCWGINNLSLSDRAIIEYGDSKGEYVCFYGNGGVTYIDIGGYTSNPQAVFQTGNTTLDSYVMLDYEYFSYERFEYMSGNLKISKLYLPYPENFDDTCYLSEIKELANNRNCDIILFDNYYSAVYDNCSIEVFGNLEDISNETLICVNAGETRLRVLGDGFHNVVNCDIAVVTDGYCGDEEDIMSDRICAKNDFLKANETFNSFLSFDDTLRVEIDILESDYKIYEP